MKAIEKDFHVVLFFILYKVFSTFKCVGETLLCDHLDESYWTVPLCGTSMIGQSTLSHILNLVTTKIKVTI